MTHQVGSVLEPQVLSFTSTSVDLKRLLKNVSKQSGDAVAALASLLTNEDPKIKLAAAKALLELQVNVATTISDDQLKRLIAETKLGANSTKQLVDANDAPMVDFTTIREV